MASRIVRTVRFVKRIYRSWIQLFNRWKNQVVTKWSLEKFVDPYGSYGPYELNNGFTDRANRTVREKDLRIVNIVFNRLKSQVVIKWSLEKFVDPYGPHELKMASRIVRTVRFVKRIYGSWIQLFNRWKNQVVTEWSLEKFVDPYGSYGPYELNNGFTDRANRTVREKDLRIVNIVFNRLKSQVVIKWSLEKFVDPYGPHELKMASRIVRTVRFVKRIYGSWIQLFNRWKNQVVTEWSLEKFVDPYGSYGPHKLKMASRIVRTVRFVERIYGSWIQLFNRWKNQVVTEWSLEKFVDPYGSYGPYELNNGFTDRANRTVREKDLRIVNIVFNRLKSQVVIKWSLEKFVDPYGPHELKMASRIVRTVRFVKRIYGSWIQLFNRWKNQVVTEWSLEKFVDPYGSYGPYELNNGFTDRTNRAVREKDLRIVNIVFNRWKRQLVTGSLEKFVDSYGSYGPYELKMASRMVRTVRFVTKIYGSWINFSIG